MPCEYYLEIVIFSLLPTHKVPFVSGRLIGSTVRTVCILDDVSVTQKPGTYSSEFYNSFVLPQLIINVIVTFD